jgi:hypothetical protein
VIGELRVVVYSDVEGRDRMRGGRTAAEHHKGKHRGRGERDWNPEARAAERRVSPPVAIISLRAIARALGVVGGVECGKDRSADHRGRPQHLGALAGQLLDGALFSIASAAISASGEMLLSGAKLVGAQLTIDMSGQIFLDVYAAVQVIVPDYDAPFAVRRP